MRRAIFILIAAAALAVPAIALATVTQHASSGGVSAKLTFTRGKYSTVRNIHVRITSAGKVVYSHGLNPGHCGKYCVINGKSVFVKNLEGASNPRDVIVSVYSGGAHCCSYAAVYSPSTSGTTYTKSLYDFGDPGFLLKQLSGHTEFVTANDAFAYRFADFAESGMPIQILSFASHHFTDVTAQHPKMVTKDSKQWWTAYRKDHQKGRVGLIAAWTADQYTLCHQQHANSTLSSQVHQGHLTQKFVKKLKTFLKKHGYPAVCSQHG